MSTVTSEQIEQLRQRRSKLQFHMEQAIKERETLQEEINQLLPDIESQFGTTDPEKLAAIAEELQVQIDKQIQELSEMGINL